MDSDKSYPYGLKSLNECMSRAVLLAQPTDIPKFLAEYTSELSNSERTVDQTDPKVASFRHQEQWEKKYFRTITIKGKRRRDVASARPTTAPEKPSEPSSSQLGPLRRVRTNGASSVGVPAPPPEEMAPIPPATVKEHHPAQKTKTEAPHRASSVPVRKERAVTAAQVPSFLLFRKPAPTPRELRQPQKVTPILPAIVKDRHPTPPKIKTEVAVRVLSRPESSALPPLPRKPGLAPIQQESFTKGTTDVMKIPKPAFPTRKDISTPKSRVASKSSILPNHSVPPLLRKPTAEKKKKKKKKKKAQKSNRTTSTSKDVSVPISELLARAVQPPLMQEQKRSLLPNRRDDDKTRTDSKPGSKPVVPEPENTKTRLVTTRPPRPQTTKEKGPTTKLPKSEGTVKKVTVITFPSKDTTINWPMTTKVLGKKGTRILPPIMTPLVSESIMGDRTTTKEPGLRDTTKLSPIMNFAGPENTREERPMTTEDQGSEGTWFTRVPSPPSTREQPATPEVQEPKSAMPVPKGPEMNKTQPASPKVPEPTSTSTWSWFTKSVVGGLDETRQELPMMPKPPGGTRTQLITPLIHVPQTTSTQSVTCSKKMPTLTEDQTAGHKKTCPHGHPVHIIRYRRLTSSHLPRTSTQGAVETAIAAGYRHIDTAYSYKNEVDIGKALRSKMQQGIIRREDMFIVSKLWITHHAPEDILVCLNKSLNDLQLDYLDLYLVHFPVGLKKMDDELFPKKDGVMLTSDIDYVDVWRGMEALQASGKVKSIGVSNFSILQLERLLALCKVPPAVNQVELHPYLVQTEMIEFCKSKNIVLTAYSPFGSPGRPPELIKGETDPAKLLEDPVVTEIAKKHRRSSAQVLLRYHVQQGIAVIPKSDKPHHILQNTKIFDFSLSEEDMTALKGLDRGWRACDIEELQSHPYYPFV